jgi:hypothetical protein
LLLLVSAPASAATASCNLEYELPADFPKDVIIRHQATDEDFMLFAWQHFLALNASAVNGQISVTGDNETQWSNWSSTADLYDAIHPGPAGSRFYPIACRGIPGFQQYRVLQQVGKADDSFLEAQTGGLSDDPVVDADGKFVRYEILYSPAMYEQVIAQMLNEQSELLTLSADVNLSCGVDTYTGGDPSNPDMGAIMLKVAWRDASDLSPQERAKFHVEDLLVFTPGYRNSTGKNTCELKPMAMVGMHIAHKTTKQPSWVWATFEHRMNAPDCISQAPAPQKPGGAEVNKACPTGSAADGYSFFPATCDGNDSCAECNTAPAPNGAPGQCDNPLDGDEDSWCLDLPPSPVAGMSRLCRQVPSNVCSEDVSLTCSSDADCDGAGTCVESYAAVAEQNTACWNAIVEGAGGGKSSVWLNYELIGSQWVAKTFDQCLNQVASVVKLPANTQTAPGPVLTKNLRELVVLDTDPMVERPLLGNTSMESYDRPNCLGCHSKSYMGSFCANDPSLQCSADSDCTSVGGTCTLYSFNTDLTYSFKLEVGQQPGLRLPGSSLLYLDEPYKASASVDWTMKSPAVLLGLAESFDDPRCNGDPRGTTRAFMRFVRDGVALSRPQIELPCQGWSLIGNPANPESYLYRDDQGAWGPCQEVVIDAYDGVAARCSGPGIPQKMADANATLNVVLKTGSLRYCAQYSSFRTLKFVGTDAAKSTDNEPPDLCSVW